MQTPASTTPEAAQTAALPLAGPRLDAAPGSFAPGLDLSRAVVGVPAVPARTAKPDPLSVDAVLSPFVSVFCVAFVLAYLATPIMRVVAVAYGIIDRPDLVRKLHARPVAYLGGVAVFIGFFAALATAQLVSTNPNPRVVVQDQAIRIPIAFVAGTVVVVGLGLLDDLRGVRPKLKIVGQLAAAAALYFSGIGDNIMELPVANLAEWLHLDLGLPLPTGVEKALSYGLSAILTAVIVVFCCNATNLMDGLDGLCGGITAIIAFGLIFVAAHLLMTGPASRAPEDAVRLAVAIALLGSVLGFLPYNFNPASIFMGDTGSLFMGFVVAASILSLGEVGTKWMMGGLVMFSLPMLDTALAFARRYVARRPFFSADRHHFHHQLVSRGLSVRRAVVLSYGLTIFFVACGCLLIFLRTRYVIAFYLVLFGSIIVAAYKMGMVHERPVVVKPLRKRELQSDEPLAEPAERPAPTERDLTPALAVGDPA